MNKEEIYEYLEYQGIYDTKVKRRLRKLIKKYHPDQNKTDKKTIFLLYEVKQELESGKATKYEKANEESSKEEKVEAQSKVYAPFMEKMIEILKRKREFVELKLRRHNKKLSVFQGKRSKMTEEMNKVIFHIGELDHEKRNLEKIQGFDIFFIVIIVILTSLFFVNFKSIWIIMTMILVLIEAVLIILRVGRISRISEEKIELKKEQEKYNSLKEKYDKVVKQVEKECVQLKFERNALSNDIQFYHNELSKILATTYTIVKEQKKNTSYRKTL